MIDTARHKRIQAKMNSPEELEALRIAGKILDRKGYVVLVPMFRNNAKTINDIEANSDNGDIYLFNIQDETFRVIEVKRLTANNKGAFFTCKTDWIYNNFIVDGVNQFEKKNPKPYAYICFNYPLTAYAAIRTETRKRWTVSNRNGNESKKDYYIADLSDVKFHRVSQEVLQLTQEKE